MTTQRFQRITAAGHGEALTLSVPVGSITASATSRLLAGPVVRYGVVGRTSKGPLKVAPGALRFPDDLSAVKLTKEHFRDQSRGHLALVEDDGQVLRVAAKVADGPDGDDALREAADKSRDGFSFDVVDAVVRGDTITAALVVAIGQVGIPAYDSMRIDTIAASAANNPEGTTTVNEAQRARLAELQAKAKDDLSPEEASELAALEALNAATSAQAQASADQEPAPVAVTASMPSAVPAGVPQTRAPAATRERTDDLAAFIQSLFAVVNPQSQTGTITAALNDITHAQHSANVEAPGWSGELWSGVQYEPEFTPLFSQGSLTNYEGKGWRWVVKPQMYDYAGNKAAITSDTPTTEDSEYQAARMAVGHDIDRKFYDFPNAAFIQSYVEACREDWAVKLDTKVHAYTIANAVAVESAPAVPVVADTLLKAAGLAIRAIKRRRAGRATFVVVADDDFDTLMDVTNDDVPAFLSLFNIDPANFVSSALLEPGKVLAGAKQAATVRTLPGSPIRVSAQHIANGGLDEAFFGYWAVEEHHTSGIASVEFVPA